MYIKQVSKFEKEGAYEQFTCEYQGSAVCSL